MKISLNWLKKLVDIPVSDDELVRLIGARLVEVEGIIDETYKYDNIYVVQVEFCEKIPETHLSLCQINVGTGELVQVVCGAPNVHEGMLAAWIAPGATVPASVHEDAPFVIGKRKMLGKYESNGMLASASELDFGEDHSGIVEIDPGMAKPGDLLADVFELNDMILEIENKSLTHRPDCFGMIGFAREVAGILGQAFEISHLGYTQGRSPKLTVLNEVFSNAITIKLNASVCSRYSAIVLEKHGEIEKKYLTWQDTVLAKSGMKPISPIVDATNYLMLLTGQPLHAFDYDKFVAVGGKESPEIKVRLAEKGEKLVLLDDTEIELNESDIIVCSGDVPVALAGAMGGKSTMITEETRNIILESATFSLYNLRKTQMAHGIFTEAITRFTKGQPPYQTLTVAEACAGMLGGGFRVVAATDEYPQPEKDIVVKITTIEINDLLGTDYDEKAISKVLENVGFKVKGRNGSFEVTVPAWRTDIHIKEDIIEEIGRLFGYDNIKPTLPLHATAELNQLYDFKVKLKNTLARYGANEILTYSFVSERLLDKVGQDVKNSYKIVNSISPELQYVRQSIVPSLLEKTYLNEKLPVEKFAIFEMNEVYQKKFGLDKDGVPVEKISLGLVVAERKNQETAFYKAKKYVAKILEECGIEAECLPLKSDNAEAKPFEPKRSAEIVVDGEYIGVVGEFKNSVRNEFKLAPYVAGFEVDLVTLAGKAKKTKTIMTEEKMTEDLTLTTDKTYAEALVEAKKQYPDAIKIIPLSVYQAEGQTTRNISFRIIHKK